MSYYTDARHIGYYPPGWVPDHKACILVYDDTHEHDAECIVCPVCGGRGKHVNPNIDDRGITGSEMQELGEDFQDMYFSGALDISCKGCAGLRVVLTCEAMIEDKGQMVADASTRWYEDGCPE